MKRVSISLGLIGIILILIAIGIELNQYNGIILFIIAGAFIFLATVIRICKKRTAIFSFGMLALYIAIICQYLMFGNFNILSTNTYLMAFLVAGILLTAYGIMANNLKGKN